MSSLLKREVPLAIATAFAVTMIASFFLNIDSVKTVATEFQKALVPIGASAAIVGGLNLALHHVNSVLRKRKNQYYSAIFLIVMLFFTVTSSVPQLLDFHNTLYATIVGKTNEAMWGIIALFMLSMAYRAFKIKNLDTFLFTASCLIVLVGNAPIGEIVLPMGRPLMQWILEVPTMAAMRAMTIGVALGIVGYGTRVIFGKERTVLGEVATEET